MADIRTQLRGVSFHRDSSSIGVDGTRVDAAARPVGVIESSRSKKVESKESARDFIPRARKCRLSCVVNGVNSAYLTRAKQALLKKTIASFCEVGIEHVAEPTLEDIKVFVARKHDETEWDVFTSFLRGQESQGQGILGELSFQIRVPAAFNLRLALLLLLASLPANLYLERPMLSRWQVIGWICWPFSLFVLTALYAVHQVTNAQSEEPVQNLPFPPGVWHGRIVLPIFVALFCVFFRLNGGVLDLFLLGILARIFYKLSDFREVRGRKVTSLSYSSHLMLIIRLLGQKVLVWANYAFCLLTLFYGGVLDLAIAFLAGQCIGVNNGGLVTYIWDGTCSRKERDRELHTTRIIRQKYPYIKTHTLTHYSISLLTPN